jgi:hypothetical protein
MQTLMATMDSIQLDQITFKSGVVLERLKAPRSSQYICGTSKPDTSHIIDQVLISDGNGEMQCVRGLIGCGATRIFIALRLRIPLGPADILAYVMTLGVNGQVMAHASDSQKTALTVQYMKHLSPVQESEVFVAPMRACNLVLGLPCFQSRNPDIHWQSGRLMARRIARVAEGGAVDRVAHQECPANVPGSTARDEACSKGGGGIPHIQIIG